MKKILFLVILGLAAAFGLWSAREVRQVASSEVLGITSTPSNFTPTPLPTEFLTPIPSETPKPTLPRPTATQVPTSTRVPPEKKDNSETPSVLPVLGSGSKAGWEQKDDSPITRITIPSLELDAPVKRVPLADSAWNIKDLGAQVGWLDGTSNPAMGGNTVLAGHLDLIDAPGPFRILGWIRPGAEIIVYTSNAVYQYRVTGKEIVAANDMTVVQQTSLPRLTLLTCDWDSYDAVTHLYRRRLVIYARLEISNSQ
jgi:LPXTG-site transpeptidase (sortase) family protein